MDRINTNLDCRDNTEREIMNFARAALNLDDDELCQLNIEIPRYLKDKLKAYASISNRSLKGLVIEILSKQLVTI